MAVHEYLNCALIGNESSSIDANSYSVIVEKSLSSQEVKTVFTEVTSIFGTAESIKFGKRRSEKTKPYLKNQTFSRAKARIALNLFKEGEVYVEEIKHPPREKQYDPVDDDSIQRMLLKALGNIRKLQPKNYKGVHFEISGFCQLLHIDEQKFYYNTSVLQEELMIQSNLGVETGNIFITNKGLKELSQESGLNIVSERFEGLRVRTDNFVDPSRLQELMSIKCDKFDLARLIQLCQEVNVAHKNNCFMSIAMILRTIINHVPPVFEVNAFAEIANNYGGTKSFKESMQHLNTSLRKIADSHLHVPIRKKEILPTFNQVNFSADLDVLLSEIVRLLK